MVETLRRTRRTIMDIVIGPTSSIGTPGRQGVTNSGEAVEAKVLSVRPPRQRRGPPPVGEDERRNGKSSEDPTSGRVMVLLIPEGYKVPRDIESGNYRIFVRFVPRRG
jgi:hypothetical protein